MLKLLLLTASGFSLFCGASIVYFMKGHEVAAFMMVLTSAVLLVGASIVHVLDDVAYYLSRRDRADFP